MGDQKKFKAGRFSRITKLGKTLAVASGHLAMDLAKEKTEKLLKKAEDVQDLSRKIKATQEVISSMGELKGALMKLGQMISISEDLFLPPEITAMFRELQKNSPPMSDENLNSVFMESFGKLPEEMFKEFDREPVAAASIGQVHQAVTEEGEKVAVKVQYPDIQKAIESDFKNLDKLESMLRVIFPKLPNIDSYVEELKRSLVEECDYEIEASHIEFFKEELKKFPDILIPKVFKELSSRHILTMEYMKGESFEETLVYSKEERDHLGQLLYDSYMYSFYSLNCLHTDPQNGNYLFQRDKVIMLDFGSVRRFPMDFMKDFVKLLIAVEEDQFEAYQESIIELGFFEKEDDIALFQNHFELIKKIYSPYVKEGRYAIPKSNPIDQIKAFIDGVELKNRNTPREEFLLFDRSNLGIYTKIKAWDSEVDWVGSKLLYRNEFLKKAKES